MCIRDRFRAVVKDGPADQAGLKSGDIILEMDGVKIDANTSLQKLVSMYKPKQDVSSQVWRDGTTINLQVELGEFEVE